MGNPWSALREGLAEAARMLSYLGLVTDSGSADAVADMIPARVAHLTTGRSLAQPPTARHYTDCVVRAVAPPSLTTYSFIGS